MKIIPLAADSMGVRSVATYVETDDCKIVIDPSAALGPRRFNLPPSNVENLALKKFKTKINLAVKDADIIIISHYHHDHYNPRANYYKGKKIFVKSEKADINYSQRERAVRLKEKFKRLSVSSKVKRTDGKAFELGNELSLSFSYAVPHGSIGTKIGYVVMTTIRDPAYTFMHTSDVSGPVEKSTTDIIIANEPDLVYIDGPPTHLLDTHLSIPDLEKAINNISDILNYTHTRIIMDHHLLRDINYRELFHEVYKNNNRIVTAAEFMNMQNNLLEATRDSLWKTDGGTLVEKKDKKTLKAD